LASGSHNPASVFIPCVLATVCTTIASILIVAFKQKLKWDKVLVGGILALVTFVSVLMYWVNTMNDEQKNLFGKVAGNVLLLIIIVAIIIGGVVKKLNVFDAFIEGAQHGFGVVLKVIPYFVGMLVAIRVFRDSGSLTYLVNGISYLISLTGIDTAFTPALPVAIMKPFSGGGARGLMLDTMKTYGADSFVGQLASTFQGSSDTTFYIIALYYGSVGIKKIRYSLWAGIAADIIGVICAILIGYIFFKH
ncbi:MAG: nucleoside recognition domain-containing protein, partial [Bacteroidota bacterium]